MKRSDIEYIAFDFETGGVDSSRNPILTAYFSFLDKDLNKIDELNLKIRPSAKFSVVEQEALDVNGINLDSHDKDPETLNVEDASKKLHTFLDSYLEKKKRGKKPRPLGHNISFDIGFIHQLLEMKEWNNYIHYGFVCTFSISSFLKAAGILPDSLGNLGSLVKHFAVEQRSAHEAKSDVLMTIDVYGKMLGMVKNMSESSGGVAVDLISALEK